MYLLDTNIFLEILLAQQKATACKEFLIKNSTSCHLSDFTLYSIGIAMFRNKLFDAYDSFCQDVTGMVTICALPVPRQSHVSSSAKKLGLDYDDAYQFEVAKHFKLSIVTMDKDFKKIKDVEIVFL